MSSRELLILVVIGLLLVAAIRLPALARALGESIAEFERASRLMLPVPNPLPQGVAWLLVGVLVVLALAMAGR